MFKNTSYFWLALALIVVEIFIIDQLSIAMWLRPMIFPLIIILLPMEWRTIWVLMVALVVGIVMDMSLGGAGLYTATLLPLAVVRSSVMYLTTRRGVEPGDQTPLLSRIAMRQMMIFVGAMLLIHHALFFSLEAMSVALLWQLVATIVMSTLLSLVIAWPIVRLFISKIVR